VLRGRDTIFDWLDPLPFLLVHRLQVQPLLPAPRQKWIKVDVTIGKLVEPAGDRALTRRVLFLVGSAVSGQRSAVSGQRSASSTATGPGSTPGPAWPPPPISVVTRQV